ncbi:MAG: serine protein kinase RIO [Candidatus Bathyarchaeota archaeon]|nr:serine protein kinase RIO [Candidatus Bathyarchaeota archaeon]
MPSQNKMERKADKLQRRYEETDLMLNKNQEEFNVSDAVFDRPTLEGVLRLIQKKKIDKIKGALKAGKEAHIYWGTAPDGAEIAVKIYYTTSAEFRKGMMRYIEGDPRFKRIRTDPKSLVYTWTQKEFSNLQLAEQGGVNAPRPIDFLRNILVMTFIGFDGVPAPLLRELPLENPNDFYDKLTDEMRTLYQKSGLVHGDLSEYNIMVWEKKPVIFDVSQAMLKNHPLAPSLLQHDVETINKYFAKLGVEVYDNKELEEWVKSGEA